MRVCMKYEKSLRTCYRNTKKRDSNGMAYQANKNTKKLNDICVGNRIKASDESVKNGHARRKDYRFFYR